MNNLTFNVHFKKRVLTFSKLPLAVYREIVSHLRQIDGVNAGLIPQESKEFDYLQSQVGGLWIECENDFNSGQNQQLESVLAFYANKFGDFT